MLIRCMSLCVIGGAMVVGCGAGAEIHGAARDWKRIACVGHSFTDGNTWPYLVRQALTDAGRPEPILINAAAGGDVAANNLRRLDWAVLKFEPDLAIVMSCSHNVGKMTGAEFRDAMEEMIAKLQASGATVLLLFGHMRCPEGMQPADMKDVARVRGVVGGETEAMAAEADTLDASWDGDVRIQRALAQKHGCLTGDMKPELVKAFERGHWIWEPDRLHLNLAGYRAIARTALDALGYEHVAVPEQLTLKPLPGLVTPWRVRAIGDGEAPLDEQTVRRAEPDGTWKTVTLPEKEPLDSWWPDQVRREGYCMSLEKMLGKASRYVGVASYRAEGPGTVWLNTGGLLRAVWVNGAKVYLEGEWNGFHAGARRLAVSVEAGENRIVIETGAQFALNITPGPLW